MVTSLTYETPSFHIGMPPSALFGRMRGGIAIAVVFISVLLAALTGIVGAAVVLAILSVSLMLKHNYSPQLACGVIFATGTLSILIPPSVMLVMMADQVRVSVGDLFMGAIFPALLLGLLYAVSILIHAWIVPDAAPAPAPKDAEPVPPKLLYNVVLAIIPTAGLISLVLGSIFFGIATPTEVSGVGALGATLLALVRGRLPISALQDVVQRHVCGLPTNLLCHTTGRMCIVLYKGCRFQGD